MWGARRHARLILGTAGLFLAYTVTAKLGLRFDALSGVATTVWPPSGIALVVLFRLGVGAWPGVALAALLVNVQAGQPLAAAALIALGNTLEAVVGATLLRRGAFRPEMERLRDVLLLAIAAALVSTTISATLGTLAVWLGSGGAPFPLGYGALWSVWWIGDVMGDLLVAPVLFTWSGDSHISRRPRRWLEAAALSALLPLAALISFAAPFMERFGHGVRGTHIMGPFLIWAALRFGPRGATTALFLVATVAVVCTASGRGPFVQATPHDSLRLLQSYLSVTAITIAMLAAALAERRQAVSARDDFLSIASHELKTPLTALKLKLGTVARRLASGGETSPTAASAGRLARDVSASERYVRRLERLIEDLLDVSRLRTGRLLLRLERTSLPDLVREAAGRFVEEMARTGTTLELDLPERMDVTCDRSRIEQVITNLVANALKYAPGKAVHVSLRAVAGRARVEVRDEGSGISKKEQAHIFEPYRRAAVPQHVAGLGLGLYIGRQIAETHGGTLTVESGVGPGACFVLDIPVDGVG